MATKKTEAKAPKTSVKKDVKKIDYKAMSVADLDKQLQEKHKDLLDAKTSLLSGEMVNPRVLGATRKEIARIHTALVVAKAADKESK